MRTLKAQFLLAQAHPEGHTFKSDMMQDSRCVIIRTSCRAQPPKYDIDMMQDCVGKQGHLCLEFVAVARLISMSYFGGCALHGVRIKTQRDRVSFEFRV